jgi:hypothetical protein
VAAYVTNQQDSRSTKQLPATTDVAGRKYQSPEFPNPVRSAIDDEEVMFVIKHVRWILVIAVMPLILFLIVHHFCPELFLISITPN